MACLRHVSEQFKLDTSVDLKNQRVVISSQWVLRITSHYRYRSVCCQLCFPEGRCKGSRPRTGATLAHRLAAGGEGAATKGTAALEATQASKN